jgi:hypothetical protein
VNLGPLKPKSIALVFETKFRKLLEEERPELEPLLFSDFLTILFRSLMINQIPEKLQIKFSKKDQKLLLFAT